MNFHGHTIFRTLLNLYRNYLGFLGNFKRKCIPKMYGPLWLMANAKIDRYLSALCSKDFSNQYNHIFYI